MPLDRRRRRDKRVEEDELLFDTAEQQEENDSADQDLLNIPQVLTRAVIPTLAVTALDASDELELYYLTRPTVLHAGSSAALLDHPIRVTKAALGLRYRPYSLSSGSGRNTVINQYLQQQQPLELTIEYGAARAGPNLQHESAPRVVVESDHGEDSTSTSVHWDNEAKVYYTQRIDSRIYTTANYLASLSGTVLEKLLNSAVDLMESSTAGGGQRHRRYQPFGVSLETTTVVGGSGDNDSNGGGEDGESKTTTTTQQLLRSSSDVDFLQQLYHVLADLGVELQPVIRPVTAHLRLHAAPDAKLEKVQTGVAVPPAVPAQFYQKLYNCLSAIASANYTAYSDSANTNSNTNSSSSDVLPPLMRNLRLNHPPEDVQNKPPHAISSVMAKAPTTAKPPTAPPPPPPPSAPITSAAQTAALPSTHSPTSAPSIVAGDTDDDDSGNGGAAMDIGANTAEAAQAAATAQEAAHAADHATSEQDAKTAAQAAATAAQKAADVTASQAATMAAAALTSGDGRVVTQTAALCFQDPVYGLGVLPPPEEEDYDPQSTTNETTTTTTSTTPNIVTAYLYWDGAFYYRVNLTAPYISIITEQQFMPQPPVAGISREDFVDWTIFLLIAVGTLLGFLLLLQQISGRRFVPKLFKYQRWFFQPRHYSLDDDDRDEMSQRGVGKVFSFGQDAIPLSMGGRRMGTVFSDRDDARLMEKAENWLRGNGGVGGGYRNIVDKESSSLVNDGGMDELELSEHDFGGDLELVEPPTPSSHNNNGTYSGRHNSYHSSDDADVSESDTLEGTQMDGTPTRLYRDPNLVDMPDLKSKSKVAVPVSISLHHQSSLNDG